VAYEVVLDSAARACIAGTSSSSDFPTANSFQGANAGSYDFFVAKFDSSGSALIFSTYLGGSNIDYCLDLTLDSADDIYLQGRTYSSDFPTLNPYQASNAGSPDLALAKLTSSGSGLIYSTYLGGSDIEYAKGVESNGSPEVHIYGETFSDDFPTRNAYMSSLPGNRSLLVGKLASSGSALG
jgi:hypothetical protein